VNCPDNVPAQCLSHFCATERFRREHVKHEFFTSKMLAKPAVITKHFSTKDKFGEVDFERYRQQEDKGFYQSAQMFLMCVHLKWPKSYRTAEVAHENAQRHSTLSR
jgi:hypothetical protein